MNAGKELPEEFSEADLQKKDNLLKEGFASWNKRDFFKFINMCEIYGRSNFEMYNELLSVGKSLDEIS
jgi:SWI/SNF-related matrix-associated actin-dependent regulator of chromatin subfamily A member 5